MDLQSVLSQPGTYWIILIGIIVTAWTVKNIFSKANWSRRPKTSAVSDSMWDMKVHQVTSMYPDLKERLDHLSYKIRSVDSTTAHGAFLIMLDKAVAKADRNELEINLEKIEKFFKKYQLD